MKAINDLIQQNDRDIARFREQIAKLLRKPATQRHVSDFERCIAIAEKSNSTLRAAQFHHLQESERNLTDNLQAHCSQSAIS